MQQHRGAFSSSSLAQERPARQVIQAGQEPKPRGSAHQPAGTGGCWLLPVHSRQWTGDSMCHCQADGHREGRAAQHPSPPDCHAVLQHICPAHLGEARAQLGPDHRLLRSLSASYRSGSVQCACAHPGFFSTFISSGYFPLSQGLIMWSTSSP